VLKKKNLSQHLNLHPYLHLSNLLLRALQLPRLPHFQHNRLHRALLQLPMKRPFLPRQHHLRHQQVQAVLLLWICSLLVVSRKKLQMLIFQWYQQPLLNSASLLNFL